MGFLPDWGAQFPTPGSTAMDAPPGYITLYAAFFREGNFRLPMTKFTAEVLRKYGLHISQINAIGLPRVTHFEFICRANHVEPTFEMFNVFYTVTYTSGFYSFNSRTSGVILCCSTHLKSLYDWKQKFFFVRRGVISVDMHYRSASEGIPKVNVTVDYAQQGWYKKVTHKATAISQIEERALVGAGMSMLWLPKNPLGVPVYGYPGRRILLNVLDLKVGGAMVEAVQEDGKPTWLDQIRNRFLHPTIESFATYANIVLGEDSEDDVDDAIDPTREEVIVLSSEGSDRSLEGLTSHSPRAGPLQGVAHEPVNEPVGDDVEVLVETADQLETRKKTKTGKPGGNEKRAEEKATETPRMKSGKIPRKFDIPKITPPQSPPSRTFDSSPPRDELGEKKKQDDVDAEHVGEGGGGDHVAGGAGGDGRNKGIENEAQSSEATPHQTIYTRRPPGGGGGATSGVVWSPQFENVRADSWDTHNPACDDLPHAPHWNLT
ncbi:hypothetical protein Hdeb2414_s0003g00089981 [Helianthus debilis subsp. tardiflorus]